ncbi:hypothetical protein GPECTOR_7g1225 [Gonium pectorale]|uniref:Uncharacterized protein n=1 Tax=Gonium pectorale TaxID=33097 RepID=A0A150GU34_GONPE|nr:hypothetical protein GPECTOR_7g1225 [Gonium pectorale]|eukprot:KXZ53331.1 hypothetical protein GPECTOR_7g1225 [Gonium pectorale]
MGNVATLLVRWPHAPLQKVPRSWREVTDNDRFQYLFPRRPQPFVQRAMDAYEELLHAASVSPDNDPDKVASGSGGRLGAVDSGLSHAHQAALTELLERLQSWQQHLQDTDDISSDKSTIITIAAVSTDDDGDSAFAEHAGSTGNDHDSTGSGDRAESRGSAEPLTAQSGCSQGPHRNGQSRRAEKTGEDDIDPPDEPPA